MTETKCAPDEQEHCHEGQPDELQLQPLRQRNNNVRAAVLPPGKWPVLQISKHKLDAEDGVDNDRNYGWVEQSMSQ